MKMKDYVINNITCNRQAAVTLAMLNGIFSPKANFDARLKGMAALNELIGDSTTSAAGVEKFILRHLKEVAMYEVNEKKFIFFLIDKNVCSDVFGEYANFVIFEGGFFNKFQFVGPDTTKIWLNNFNGDMIPVTDELIINTLKEFSK